MTFSLDPLLSLAFFTGPAAEANAVLDAARAAFPSPEGPGRAAFSYEVVVPEAPDPAWLEERFLSRLVYHCESRRAPLPACAGVFVTLFVGPQLYCVAASEVVAWAQGQLGCSSEALVERFGTGERRGPMPPPPSGLLLPGGGE